MMENDAFVEAQESMLNELLNMIDELEGTLSHIKQLADEIAEDIAISKTKELDSTEDRI